MTKIHPHPQSARIQADNSATVDGQSAVSQVPSDARQSTHFHPSWHVCASSSPPLQITLPRHEWRVSFSLRNGSVGAKGGGLFEQCLQRDAGGHPCALPSELLYLRQRHHSAPSHGDKVSNGTFPRFPGVICCLHQLQSVWLLKQLASFPQAAIFEESQHGRQPARKCVSSFSFSVCPHSFDVCACRPASWHCHSFQPDPSPFGL